MEKNRSTRHRMSKAHLLRRLARLESINDQLVAEVSYVDELMRDIGFAEGLHTVKVAASELIELGSEMPNGA